MSYGGSIWDPSHGGRGGVAGPGAYVYIIVYSIYIFIYIYIYVDIEAIGNFFEWMPSGLIGCGSQRREGNLCARKGGGCGCSPKGLQGLKDEK